MISDFFDKPEIKKSPSETRPGQGRHTNLQSHKQKSTKKNQQSLTFSPSWPCNKHITEITSVKCFSKQFYKAKYQSNLQGVQGSLFVHVDHEDRYAPVKISQLINNLLPVENNSKRKVKHNVPAFLYDLFDLSAPANQDSPKKKIWQAN